MGAHPTEVPPSAKPKIDAALKVLKDKKSLLQDHLAALNDLIAVLPQLPEVSALIPFRDLILAYVVHLAWFVVVVWLELAEPPSFGCCGDVLL